jgi:protein SCO1/2
VKSSYLIGLAAALALAGGVLVAVFFASSEGAQSKYIQLYPQPRQLKDFELFDQDGHVFEKANLLGHWTLTFVGYTFCPDVCPTTLAELKRIYPQLQQIRADFPVQVMFLSVDPQRDTAERLKEYIQYFHPDFIAVSAPHTQLFPLVRSMGMMYSMSESTENANYLVDHSASVVVVNPQAQVVGRFKPDIQPGKISVSDGDQILADMTIIMGSH